MKYRHKMKLQKAAKVNGQKCHVGHTIRQHEELQTLRKAVLFLPFATQRKSLACAVCVSGTSPDAGGLEGKKYHFIGLVKLRIFADRNTKFNIMK